MKLKSVYVCSQCQAQAPRWSGQCEKCRAWNSLVEDVIDTSSEKQITLNIAPAKPMATLSGAALKNTRLATGIGELDRVLGGGFVHDAVVLLVGDPGIGKSTLTLQMADAMAALGRRVLYFSGEESVEQISARARRLGLKNAIGLVNQNSLEVILSTIEAEKPGFVIVDSVQVMAGEVLSAQAGSVSQVRHVAERLMRVAKNQGIPMLLIGHVTKDGQLAGPQVLTHLVDAVLYLEGDRFQQFRLLRAAKNRFGAVDEVGVFAMQSGGLAEVKNPSALFLEGRAANPIGSVICPTIEGTRTFLVEVQALTGGTSFGYPKRTANGFDLNRLNLIIAVLSRYADMKLDSCDVFVNVVGGLRLTEPAADLAVAMAIASSKLKKPLPADLAVMGEIGLSGEVRQVTQAEKRSKEAEKLGFKKILSSPGVRAVVDAVRAIG